WLAGFDQLASDMGHIVDYVNRVIAQRGIMMEPLLPPATDNSTSHDSVPDPLIAEAHAPFEEMRSKRPNEPLVPDGSSFDRAIVLGVGLGLAAIVILDYLKYHSPGYQFLKSTIREHAGRTLDVVDIATADGSSKTLYFTP